MDHFEQFNLNVVRILELVDEEIPDLQFSEGFRIRYHHVYKERHAFCQLKTVGTAHIGGMQVLGGDENPANQIVHKWKCIGDGFPHAGGLEALEVDALLSQRIGELNELLPQFVDIDWEGLPEIRVIFDELADERFEQVVIVLPPSVFV